MRSAFCCSLRTCVLTVGAVFLVCQTALLALTLLLAASDVEGGVASAIEWFEAEVEREDVLLGGYEEQAIQRASDFLAIPVTLSIVLMIADSLLIWAAVSQHRILLWPWLVLYAVEYVLLVALLVYFMVVLPKTYLKVIAFLVVCPFLVVFFFCWFVVKCFYNYLRDLNLKEAVAAVYAQSQQKSLAGSNPPTVYPTDPPQHWDQPLPIWATQPNQAVWDPSYLQKMDPRYSGAGSYPNGSSIASGTNGGGVLSTSYYAKSSTSSHNRRTKVPPTMLPDGTLVVPIRDDADDGSDDEEELSGIIEVEEEDYDDEEDGMKSTRTSKTTLTSPGPLPPQGQTDRVAYRYQLRPSSSGRRSVAGVGSDAGSVALSDKYKRVGRVSRPKSDDQSSVAMSLSDKYRVTEEIEVEPEEVYQAMPLPPRPILPPTPVRFGDSPLNVVTSASIS